MLPSCIPILALAIWSCTFPAWATSCRARRARARPRRLESAHGSLRNATETHHRGDLTRHDGKAHVEIAETIMELSCDRSHASREIRCAPVLHVSGRLGAD